MKSIDMNYIVRVYVLHENALVIHNQQKYRELEETFTWFVEVHEELFRKVWKETKSIVKNYSCEKIKSTIILMLSFVNMSM